MAHGPSGQVRYTLKTPYRDGTTHIVLEPLDLLARLAALVPAMPPLPTPTNLPFQPDIGNQNSVRMAESFDGGSVAAIRQKAGVLGCGAAACRAVLAVGRGGRQRRHHPRSCCEAHGQSKFVAR